MSLARDFERGGATSTGISGRAPHGTQGAPQLNGKAPPAEDLDSDSHGGASGKSLWHDFARGVRDTAAAEVLVQALRVGGLIFLARALRPQDFGLLKVLVVVSMFWILLAESGIPEALIQRRDLRPEHEITAWWLTLALSLSFIGVLYFGAPLLAAAMGMPDLVSGMRLMCIPLFFEGAAICANARLQREIKFGALAAANVLGELSFLAVALTLLFTGHPQWSLPAGLSARLGVHGLVVLLADFRLPLGLPRLWAALDLGRFAFSVLVGGLITTGSGNVDYLLVGRLLGSSTLGFYAMAWDLLRFIPDRLFRIAGLVAFPAFCKLQEDDGELAQAYRNLIDYIGRVVLPIAGCVAIAAPELLASIYGHRWLPAAVPMRVLTFGLALAGIRMGIGTVYYAKDYPSFDIYLNGVRLLLIVAAVGLTAPMGLIAVCAAVGIVEAMASIVGQYLVCLLVGIRLRELAVALIPGLRTTAACMLATAIGKFVGIFLGVTAPEVLVFVVGPPAIVFCWLEADELSMMMRRAFSRKSSGLNNAAAQEA